MLKPLVAAMVIALNGPAVPQLAAGPAHGDTARDLAVSVAQVEQMEIKVQDVRPTNQTTVAILPGTVIPALNARVVSAAPFAGTLVQVHVLPGESVAKGAALATISSRELLDAKSAIAQSEAELQMADATARRKRMLADKNIHSPTLADEAEAQVAKIKAVIQQHTRSLAIGGIIVGDGGNYTLAAPAAGRIVETNAMPGDKLDAMSPAVTIDTSSDLSIELQVPGDLLARIKIGDKVQVTDGPEGKVVSIGATLDKLTRSAKVIVSVPKDSGLLSGQMVSVAILQQAETGAMSVPSSAIVRVNDTTNVFVRSETGFRLMPVTVIGRSTDAVTILGKIAQDARVAASGIPQLEQMLDAN